MSTLIYHIRLAREFISLFFDSILRQTDMFVEMDSYGLKDLVDSDVVRMGNVWFNRTSSAPAEHFHAVGRALGLALYNACLCTLTLPSVLFRRLLGWPCDLDDLVCMKPDIARGLSELLSYEPRDQVEEVFGLDFTVTVPGKNGSCADVIDLSTYSGSGSAPCDSPMETAGCALPVTGANVEQYVHEMVLFHTGGEVYPFLTAFRRGFLEVCGGPFLDTLVPDEVFIIF
jgi:ubiquitin-protein ligase E3 A